MLIFLVDLVVDRQLDVQLTQAERDLQEGMGRLTFVWDLWLGGLCTCIQVTNAEFNSRT